MERSCSSDVAVCYTAVVEEEMRSSEAVLIAQRLTIVWLLWYGPEVSEIPVLVFDTRLNTM